MKRINPATGELFTKGFIDVSGKVFNQYRLTAIGEDGFFKESWLSSEAFNRCKLVSREASRLVSQRNREVSREFVRAYKLESGCIDCGYNENPVALDFDHVRGDKSFDISKRMGSSLKIILHEIAKCEIRCANCHRVKTHAKE